MEQHNHPITGQPVDAQPTPEVTPALRDAARVVGFVVATRAKATAKLVELGANSITLTALRGSAEAISAARTSWDDFPAEEWVPLANCLGALANDTDNLTPDEREAAAELAGHYRDRAVPTL